MKHLFLLFFSIASFAWGAAAQKQGTVERAIKNPQREIESGKADVYLHKKRQLTETKIDAKKDATSVQKRKRTCGRSVAVKPKN